MYLPVSHKAPKLVSFYLLSILMTSDQSHLLTPHYPSVPVTQTATELHEVNWIETYHQPYISRISFPGSLFSASIVVEKLSFLNDNGGREERPWERGWDLGPVVVLIVIHLPLKEKFFTRLRFKEKKYVIYNLTGPQFFGKPSFSDK